MVRERCARIELSGANERDDAVVGLSVSIGKREGRSFGRDPIIYDVDLF